MVAKDIGNHPDGLYNPQYLKRCPCLIPYMYICNGCKGVYSQWVCSYSLDTNNFIYKYSVSYLSSQFSISYHSFYMSLMSSLRCIPVVIKRVILGYLSAKSCIRNN